MSTYVARYTQLHPQLWAPYAITAYPHGFHDWPDDLAAPVWTPNARIITPGGAASRTLGDYATLDAAIEACWAHLVTLDLDAKPC
ncbi:MAG TPA: hypothetical protein VF503_15035 [Sphingobium sp.]|uniref:hypothetical protein n=1 Tax=Sphingobium sp. TaxID=1912891 RepID=UPI002ED61D0A